MNTSSISSNGQAAQASSLDLFHHIARTLRVSVRHLPWALARQIHAQHQAVESRDTFFTGGNHLPLVELATFCWRADVTDFHIAAARSLGWHELARLLVLAKTHACEALELGLEHAALPVALGCEVFEWP